MMSDLTYLKKELDRVEGRVIDFGSFAGCRVEAVPRDYLAWCLCSVPLRPELFRSILRVLSRPVAPIRDWRLHAAVPSCTPMTRRPASDEANASSPAAT
jgi:hypothetical protein